MRADSQEKVQQPSFNLEHFFELSADLFCIAGYDGFFRKVNSSVSKLLGYSEEELMTVPIASFIHPDDRTITARYRDQLLNGEPLLHFENRYVTKTDDIVWLSWTSMPVPEEKLVYAIAKNITHKKSEEADRNKLIAELGNLNADLKQLSYTTSHDLRSPVNNLLSVFNLLNKHHIEDEEVHRFLAVLRSGTERLKETLNDYVDLLSQNKHLSIEKETVYFNDVFETVTRSIQTLITDSKVDIQTDFNSLPAVYFNRSYLESIFLNLISNAIKYAFPGRPAVIELHSWTENNELLLSITDNGRGFDMEKVKDRIFGMHQRFHEHNDSKGIGLYLVHHHVTIMGGSITVNSEPDKGTSFIISFAK